LRDLGNTVLVVEHDEDAIRQADWLLDIGPGAGVHGGQIVAQGTPEQVMATEGSITADYLTGRRKIVIPEIRHLNDKDRQLVIHKASGNNLKNTSISIPL